jgi:hypothetical protein
MEALATDAIIPSDSSSIAPNSDRRLTGICCRRSKGPIVLEEEFINALKIAKKDSHPKNSFFEAEHPP